MIVADTADTVMILDEWASDPTMPFWVGFVIIGATTVGVIGLGLLILGARKRYERAGAKSKAIGTVCIVAAITVTFVFVNLHATGFFGGVSVSGFDVAVETAYGLESSSLPSDKPKDGCLPMVWRDDAGIRSGTLCLLDGEVVITDADGEHLPLAGQAPGDRE